MTGLIKATSVATLDLAQLGSLADPSSPAVERSEVDVLRLQVQDLQRRIDEVKADKEAACARVGRERWEAGHRAGSLEAEDGARRQVEAVQQGIELALTDLRTAIASTERLAVIIARETLDRIFGMSDDRAEQICAIVAHQLQELDGRGILRVDVSAVDFADGAALDALQSLFGDCVSVQADHDLASGRCLMKLELGTIEVGPAVQWGRLREALTDFAEAGRS